MNLKKYAPKDAALIRDNPDASPDKLLNLGLSKKAYNRLLEEPVAGNAATIEAKPIITPIATEHIPVNVQTRKSATMQIYDAVKGKVIKIGSNTAAFLLAKFPEQFQSLS